MCYGLVGVGEIRVWFMLQGMPHDAQTHTEVDDQFFPSIHVELPDKHQGNRAKKKSTRTQRTRGRGYVSLIQPDAGVKLENRGASHSQFSTYCKV